MSSGSQIVFYWREELNFIMIRQTMMIPIRNIVLKLQVGHIISIRRMFCFIYKGVFRNCQLDILSIFVHHLYCSLECTVIGWLLLVAYTEEQFLLVDFHIFLSDNLNLFLHETR